MPEKADAAAWLAVAAGIIGAFMAALDISITNSALPQIQGEIGASGTEGTWIATSYLVAEIIMIPLSGWLANLLGLRRFLIIMTMLFVSFSMLCGFSTSLGMMIFGRVGQGFTGGAMIPTAMTIVSTRLPPSQQPIGMAFFGLTAVMGPVAGPLVGGWLTENASWHYAFFLNLPVGIGLLVLLTLGLPAAKMTEELLREADWIGIVGLSVFLGCLTIVLEDGQSQQWFESQFIVMLTVLTLIGLVLLVLGQLYSKRPVIRLDILFQRSFGSVFITALVTGAALYGVAYLIPQFLSNVTGYNALQSGTVVLLSGIPMFLVMPFIPVLVRNLDLRIAIVFGLLCYATSCYIDTTLTAAADGSDFYISQVLRGFGQAFSLIFLNQAATRSVPKDVVQDAAGLYSAARNLGGSIGLAIIASLQERQISFHTQRLFEAVTANSITMQDRLRAAGTDPAGAQQVIGNLFQTIIRQATVMAFNDMFYFYFVSLILVIPLVSILKPIPKGPAVAMH
ncbi:DHA2 family efflux MFS transporter permease subunit [Rhizobium sp. ZPR3]|uniref:DHA2 family efflux MFS transporter permease subunit n=2 Tax=unclassified Rhizobium TaxID=2613769 RepID=A0AAU7SQU5_9HYPH